MILNTLIRVGLIAIVYYQKTALKLLLFSIKKHSHLTTINECFFHDNFEYEREKFVKTIEICYGQASYFNDVMELLNEIFISDERNISKFIENQLRIICNYLNISTPFQNSPSWQLDNIDNFELELRVIKKLKKIGVTRFINPIGGVELYRKEFFKKNDIDLNFLKPKEIYYEQFGSEFVPNLSIIDVMMFNSREDIELMLGNYQLK